MAELTPAQKRVREDFVRAYDAEPRLFRAPGRVNLIGEHTDYNDGFVLPFAIDLETVVAGRRRNDRRVNVVATDVGEAVQFDLEMEGERRRRRWTDYVEGPIRILDERFGVTCGADLLFSSTVPIGSGLSSSAALEISIGLAIAKLNGFAPDPTQLALSAQAAEHEYVGTRSGIMDQFASVFGRAGHAILIDCRDQTRSLVPLELGEHVVVVCDSRVHHELASGEYNKRRSECEQAVAILNNLIRGIASLRDVGLNGLEEYGRYLTPLLMRRSRHVVTENARTLEARNALSAGDLEAFGKLMYASHVSLRDDYEVSCAELDLLVDAAKDVEGVLGSRMTGGGFGGCTVSLVRNESFEAFKGSVTGKYKEAFGMEPKIFRVQASDGASEIA